MKRHYRKHYREELFASHGLPYLSGLDVATTVLAP